MQQDGVVLGLMTHRCYLEVRDATIIEYKPTQGTVKNVKFSLPQKVFNYIVWLLGRVLKGFFVVGV